MATLEKQEQTVFVYFQGGQVWEITACEIINDNQSINFADVDNRTIAEIPISGNIKAIVVQPDKVKWMEAGDLSKEILDIIRSGG